MPLGKEHHSLPFRFAVNCFPICNQIIASSILICKLVSKFNFKFFGNQHYHKKYFRKTAELLTKFILLFDLFEGRYTLSVRLLPPLVYGVKVWKGEILPFSDNLIVI